MANGNDGGDIEMHGGGGDVKLEKEWDNTSLAQPKGISGCKPVFMRKIIQKFHIKLKEKGVKGNEDRNVLA